jgi:phosphatidylglycerol:prolipoprotein diacylglycerol transferase
VLPVLRLPGLSHPVTTYNLVLALYFVVALGMTLRLAVRRDVDGGLVVALFVLCVPAALVGARLLDVLEYRAHYPTWRALVWPRGGSSIYGAFFAAALVAVVVLRRRGAPVLAVLDAGAPAAALGEAATRIACFLNGCCYGVEWHGPLAVRFPRESFAFADQQALGLVAGSAAASLPVHPVQLYSAAAMAITTVLLVRLLRRGHPDGTVVAAFLLAYGVLRLLVAPLRVEALGTMKAFSLAFVAAGGLGLALAARTGGARRVAARAEPAG